MPSYFPPEGKYSIMACGIKITVDGIGFPAPRPDLEKLVEAGILSHTKPTTVVVPERAAKAAGATKTNAPTVQPNGGSPSQSTAQDASANPPVPNDDLVDFENIAEAEQAKRDAASQSAGAKTAETPVDPAKAKK